MAIQLSDLLELPIEERLRLVEMLWDSIADFPEAIPLTDAQKRELDRRLEDLAKHPGAGSPWSEVKARILSGS
jgi:putative addiction module component (TIGR02574 family)